MKKISVVIVLVFFLSFSVSSEAFFGLFESNNANGTESNIDTNQNTVPNNNNSLTDMALQAAIDYTVQKGIEIAIEYAPVVIEKSKEIVVEYAPVVYEKSKEIAVDTFDVTKEVAVKAYDKTADACNSVINWIFSD